jgi:hypothetical protein
MEEVRRKRRQAVSELRKWAKVAVERDDHELAHVEADEVLCKFLRSLGYDDVVEAYIRVPKWFA